MGLKQFGFVRPPRKEFSRRITAELINKNMTNLPPALEYELADAPKTEWPGIFRGWHMSSDKNVSVMMPKPTLREVIDDFNHLPIELQQELHSDQQSQWSRRVTEWSTEHWKWVDEVFYGSHEEDEDEEAYLHENYPEHMKGEATIFNPDHPVDYDDLLERIWRSRMRTQLRAESDY
ncbi:hypothetical protein LTR70_009748 [Exophiala xenobiotica]|uniref:Uncharacterized protein n=1 Tax=Lithohypha guttulata TaxID=1690604 RepID=A0ABR0JWE0_9EURO|nr:hypothetical protein LTR24_009628 [Lithohypha guttulata]KAK5310095.1 hypothetical protein LTR70_009748 [Exophiala xenobiotica]